MGKFIDSGSPSRWYSASRIEAGGASKVVIELRTQAVILTITS